MRKIDTRQAEGHVLCHDITEIVKDKVKHARFRKGHIVSASDIPVLLNLGKEHLFVWEKQDGFLHEDQAAGILAQLFTGEYMTASLPTEGKITITADRQGLLEVNQDLLKEINMQDEIMVATRYSFDPIAEGEALAGTRVIPLVIAEEKLQNLVALVGQQPLLTLHPFAPKTAGIITTGSEVYQGRIKDTFTPVIVDKLAAYGVTVEEHTLLPDDKAQIAAEIRRMKDQGLDFVLCSGGMSVDPDDRTPGAIKDAGTEIITYGSPTLPGAMFLLGYLGETAVIGLPGCVMYNDTTVFDMVLPRLVANIPVTKADIAGFGHGGLCLGCDVCRWPICAYGKGQ